LKKALGPQSRGGVSILCWELAASAIEQAEDVLAIRRPDGKFQV